MVEEDPASYTYRFSKCFGRFPPAPTPHNGLRKKFQAKKIAEMSDHGMSVFSEAALEIT